MTTTSRLGWYLALLSLVGTMYVMFITFYTVHLTIVLPEDVPSIISVQNTNIERVVYQQGGREQAGGGAYYNYLEQRGLRITAAAAEMEVLEHDTFEEEIDPDEQVRILMQIMEDNIRDIPTDGPPIGNYLITDQSDGAAVETMQPKVERDHSVDKTGDSDVEHADLEHGMRHSDAEIGQVQSATKGAVDEDIEQAHPAAEQAHPAPEQAHPAAEQAHPAAEQAHPAAEQAHPAAEQAHPAAEQAHPAPELAHPAAEGAVDELEEANKLSNLTLILTESRHGSTWLMAVLGHPPNVMHFFEPLNHKISVRFRSFYPELSEDAVLRRWRATKLAQICTCDMSRHDAGGVAGYHRNYKERKTIRFIMDDCEFNRTTRVAKTIRLYDITELKLLPELGCPDFKVIHLIRDPRAVLVSRMKTFHELYDGNKVLGPHVDGPMDNFTDEYVRIAAGDLCGHHIANMQHATESWISDRYKLVLYEDIAQDPVGVARHLFRFLGQPFTEADQTFVYESSHSSNEGGGYDLSKNTSHVLNEWKGRILQRHLQVIEDTCREVFLKLGYKFGID